LNVVITKRTAFTGNSGRSRLAHGNLMKVLLIQAARKPSLPKRVFWKPLREWVFEHAQAASAPDPHHALDQRGGHIHYDRQRLENLQ
jgi:hypothetical protein